MVEGSLTAATGIFLVVLGRLRRLHCSLTLLKTGLHSLAVLGSLRVLGDVALSRVVALLYCVAEGVSHVHATQVVREVVLCHVQGLALVLRLAKSLLTQRVSAEVAFALTLLFLLLTLFHLVNRCTHEVIAGVDW